MIQTKKMNLDSEDEAGDIVLEQAASTLTVMHRSPLMICLVPVYM